MPDVFSLEGFFRRAVQADLVHHGVAAVGDQVGGQLGHLLGLDHALGGEVGAGDGDHVGVHAAGGDHVHPYALVTDLLRQGLGQPQQRVLRGRVGRLLHVALVGGHRADVDDRGTIRLPQQLQRPLAQHEGRLHIQRHNFVEGFVADCLKGAVQRHAGVVYQHVQALEVPLHDMHDVVDAPDGGDVGGQHQHVQGTAGQRRGAHQLVGA